MFAFFPNVSKTLTAVGAAFIRPATVLTIAALLASYSVFTADSNWLIDPEPDHNEARCVNFLLVSQSFLHSPCLILLSFNLVDLFLYVNIE